MKHFLILLATILLAAIWVLPGQAQSQIPVPPNLFVDSSNPVGAQAVDPRYPRTRTVTLNPDALPGAVSAQSGAPNRVSLNFFPDANFIADLKLSKTYSDGGTVWFGTLEGIPDSNVVLVQGGDLLTAQAIYPGGSYSVRPLQGSTYQVAQVRSSAFPLEPPAPSLPSSNGSVSAMSSSDDDGSQIDVLVVYDQDAMDADGGKTKIENDIRMSIEWGNLTNQNSGVHTTFNLAHVEQVSYNESNFDWNMTLNRLETPSDGYMDNVPSLRDTYHADLVVGVFKANTQYCGLGYQFTSGDLSDSGSSFSPYAYSIVAYDCNYNDPLVMVHEMGHNMGAGHDWITAPRLTGAYTYSHGNRLGYDPTTGNCQAYTVMAYYCANWSIAPHIPYWSNPIVSYSGVLTGVSGGSRPSNNALSLNNTLSMIAKFRDGPPPTAPDPLNLNQPPGTLIINLTWSNKDPTVQSIQVLRRISGQSAWTTVVTLTGTATSYSDAGAACDQSNDYTLLARSGDGSSQSIPTALTFNCVPAAPSGLTTTPGTNTPQVALAWNDMSNNEDNFILQRRLAGGVWADLVTLAANTTAYTDTSTTCGLGYEYQVRARNAQGDSGYSNIAAVNTLVCPPKAPQTFSASGVSQVRVHLSWADANSPADSPRDASAGFEVERSPDGSAWSPLDSLPAAQTSLSDYSATTQLTCNTIYFYRLRAVNANPSPSAWVSASTTTQPCAPPPDMLNFSAVPLPGDGQHSMLLTWADQDDESGYVIERWDGSAWQIIATTGLDVTRFADSGLQVNTPYLYRIHALNAWGISNYLTASGATDDHHFIYFPLLP
jgi:hypothetical protein